MAKKKRTRQPRTIKVVPEMSKTELVRAYLSEHPEAGNKEIVDALAQQGHEIGANYVSMIKSKLKGGTKRSEAPASGDFQDQLRAERDRLRKKLDAIESLLE